MDSDHWSGEDGQCLASLRKAPLSTKEDENFSCEGKRYTVYPVSLLSLASLYHHYGKCEQFTLSLSLSLTHTHTHTATHRHTHTTQPQTHRLLYLEGCLPKWKVLSLLPVSDAQFARLWRTTTESHPLQVCRVRGVDPLNLLVRGVCLLSKVLYFASAWKSWDVISGEFIIIIIIMIKCLFSANL